MTADQDGMLLFYTGTGANGKGFYFWDNTTTSWVSIGFGDKNTLDQAYDQGGAGAGKNIIANDGAVRINGLDGFLVTGTINSGNIIDTEITGVGTRMFFNPNKSAFRAGTVTGNQWDDTNIGSGSTAMGYDAVASGSSSTAMGSSTIASDFGSTAMGSSTEASDFGSTAMGSSTEASGSTSTAMGSGAVASGSSSTAMGRDTSASANFSTAMGRDTSASGIGSTAMGYDAVASGSYSTAMGRDTSASVSGSTAMGRDTSASGTNSTAMGNNTSASATNSTAMGFSTIASGGSSTAMGSSTEASGSTSTAMGSSTEASGSRSTAMGDGAVASGSRSTAMGRDTSASGTNSTAMGSSTEASAENSTAMGFNSVASGVASTAMGVDNSAPSYGETILGIYATTYTPNNPMGFDVLDRLFTIGNGLNSNFSSNALTIYKSGLMNINDEYDMPLNDGTANQVMATDGAGVVSFVDVSTITSNTTRIDDLVDGKSDNDGSQDYSSLFLGFNAGQNDDSSDNKNLGIGYFALNVNTSGEENTAIGYRAFETNSGASQNTAIGYYALRGVNGSSSSGNTAIGHRAMGGFFANTIAESNVAIGASALEDNASGDFNIAIGRNALLNSSTSSRNVAIGHNALQTVNSAAGSKTAIGYNAMANYTSNEAAVAIGAESMGNATGCEDCTAIGNQTLLANTSGIQNLALGIRALESNTTGSRNVALGTFALNTNTSGSKNIAIGNFAGAYNTQSNRLFIDSYDDFADANANGGSPLIYGEFDNDILRVNGAFQIGNPAGTGYTLPTIDGSANQIITTNGTGNLNWENPSDVFSDTDDQTLSLSGTTLSITDGNSINLSMFNIDTDDQSIDTFSFSNSSNILTLEIEDDGVAAQTVDLSILDTGGDITAVTAGNGLIGGGTTAGVALNVVANNGLTTNADNIQLGGTLTQDTNFTYGNFDTRFNLTNAGDFIIQDNGTGVFTVNSDGNTVIGNNTTWRQNSITGTITGEMLEDTNDGRFILRENGNIAVDLRANTNYIFNEQGADRDFRIESDDVVNMFHVDANNNRIGVRTGAPTATMDIEANSSGAIPHLELTEAVAGDGSRINFGNAVETDNQWTLFGRADNTEADARFNLFFSSISGGAGGNVLVATGNGDVGIGATPAYRFDTRDAAAVNYVAQIRNTNTGNDADGLRIQLGAATPGGANNFIGFLNGSGALRGRVIGTTTGVSYATTSDRRLKTNITDIDNALTLINKIQPRLYEYKANLGIQEYGFIAQELQQLYPQAVSGSSESDVAKDPMMVDYGRLTPILTAGVKELHDKVKVLELENANLKAKLDRLEAIEARLAALEGNTTSQQQNDVSSKED